MKIIYILRSFALKAGTERVMSDKMNYLAEHGYEVTLVTYEQGSHPKAFPLHPSIRHIDLKTRFYVIEKYGLLKRLIMMRRMRTLFRKRLQQTLDEVKPDYYVSTTYSINIIDIILSVRTQARKIIESHVACYTVMKSNNSNHQFMMRTLASLFDRWALGKLAKADLVVVLTKGDARDWSLYSDRVMVIPNPVTQYPEHVLPHDGNGHRIICVGRLDNQKGYDMLIDAFAMIESQCVGWYIDIFGEGSDKDMLMDKISRLGLQKRIIIHTPTPEIFNEYQRSEFLVLSSRYEGFPLVLLEAMACGIPCVAFKCKYGPEDIIQDKKDGLLVDEGDVRTLAEKMLRMITHTEERLCMGQAARRNICRYEKQTIMQKWLNLFT